jgi:hypothetical protein
MRTGSNRQVVNSICDLGNRSIYKQMCYLMMFTKYAGTAVELGIYTFFVAISERAQGEMIFDKYIASDKGTCSHWVAVRGFQASNC